MSDLRHSGSLPSEWFGGGRWKDYWWGFSSTPSGGDIFSLLPRELTDPLFLL